MVLYTASLHHARCRDDDARLGAGVQSLRLVHVADERQTVESEGVGIVFDDVVYLIVEKVDVQTENLSGVDRQRTVDEYWDLLWQLALVVEVVQQINNLLGAANRKRRNDKFTTFFNTSIVYDF